MKMILKRANTRGVVEIEVVVGLPETTNYSVVMTMASLLRTCSEALEQEEGGDTGYRDKRDVDGVLGCGAGGW